MLTTKAPPRILFVSLGNDVASDRIVAAMGRLGARCAILGAPDVFAAQSRFAERVYPLPRRGGSWARGLFLGIGLARIARDFRPDLVIPLDEFSAQSLRDPKLYRRAAREVRALLSASFGSPETFATLCSRHQLVELAASLGIATPTQVPIEDLATARRVVAELGYPIVLKREQTCGGAGVAIVHNDAALADAFRRAAAKAATKRRVQRLLARDVDADSALVLQRHVAGALAFRVLACKDGHVLDGISFRSDCVHPPVTGASTVLTPIERPDMDAAAERLVAELGCSGLVSLDFLLPIDGLAVFIELNARPVASGHLGRLLGHDIYAALLGATCGHRDNAVATTTPPPEQIALFPRELDRDPRSTTLAAGSVLHDIPWDDPASLAAHGRWLAQRHPDDGARLASLLGIEPRTEQPTRRGARLLRVGRAIFAAIESLLDLRGPASAK